MRRKPSSTAHQPCNQQADHVNHTQNKSTGFAFHLVFAFTLLLLAELAHAAQSMTLTQCLQAGLDNNPSLQASRLKTEAAGSDVKVARADFFPSISSSYSVNRIGSISASGPTETDYIDQDVHAANIKLTQIIYAGSRIVNAHDKAQFIEQAKQAELELAKLELAYNIERTFYQVLKAKQDLLSAAEAITRLTKGASAAEAFFRKELVPYVDVLKARVDLADAENQLSIAKNNENRQRIALFSLMNLPTDTDTDFSGEFDETIQELPTFDDSFSYAAEHRPDIKSLEYQRQAADKQSAIALGKYLPVVRLETGYYDHTNDYAELGESLSYEYDRDQTNRYWLAGISISWDLFDGGRSWYENEKSDLESQRFTVLMQDAKNTIATGIRKALYSMAEAKERLANSTGALAAAKENFVSEDTRLKAGVSTITALLDAQSRLVRAQTNTANAALDYQLAQSELKLMTGGLSSH